MITLILLCFIVFGCSEEDLVCTTDYQYVSLLVRGDTLTDLFTIQEKTDDTIYFDQQEFFNPNIDYRDYVVLDDSYKQVLNGNVETFMFVGKIDGEEVINEQFRIGGGKCHIYKVSGKDEISLNE